MEIVYYFYKMKKTTLTIILLITVFSIAMGFLESAVVVYLREIYYPEGFSFPLKPIEGKIGLTEILREAATIIMLVGAGIMSGRTKTEKFGFFIYCFAVWDIFYYVFLKLILDWPESLVTRDILFLIPVTWVGPVIGPVINSLTMIVLAFFISYFTDKNIKTKIKLREWLLFIVGSIVIIISYTEDYVNYMLQYFSISEMLNFKISYKLMEQASKYIPVDFTWWIYCLGEFVLIIAIVMFYYRNKKEKMIKCVNNSIIISF